MAAAAGIHGRNEDGVYLYSVVAGVHPGHQAGQVGFALKQHQRAWALARDLDLITWTFDPLVRRNAYFNLAKLGAEVTGYHEDFYGPMHDALNQGDESDRCVVVLAPGGRAVRGRRPPAARGPSRPPPFTATPSASLQPGPRGSRCARPLPVACSWRGFPRTSRRCAPATPRRHRRGAASPRTTLGRALSGGYAAVDMLRSGWYVLELRP